MCHARAMQHLGERRVRVKVMVRNASVALCQGGFFEP